LSIGFSLRSTTTLTTTDNKNYNLNNILNNNINNNNHCLNNDNNVNNHSNDDNNNDYNNLNDDDNNNNLLCLAKRLLEALPRVAEWAKLKKPPAQQSRYLRVILCTEQIVERMYFLSVT